MRSYAKINIGLNILNKREDGFHNIETIFASVNIYDEITIKQSSDGIKINCENPKIPKDESNVCYKAVQILSDYSKIEPNIEITIDKKIPFGAGLGGSSTNGAVVLNEMNSLFNLNLSELTLKEIALKLGSDVPYFLHPTVAYAKGRGEILENIDITIPYYILVVFPRLSISTKWAYEHLKKKENPTEYNYKELLIKYIGQPDKLKEYFINDFEEIVFIRYPGLINIKNFFYEKGAVYASLSGSGSSLFGFYDDKKKLERSYEFFSDNFPAFITEPNFSITKG